MGWKRSKYPIFQGDGCRKIGIKLTKNDDDPLKSCIGFILLRMMRHSCKGRLQNAYPTPAVVNFAE